MVDRYKRTINKPKLCAQTSSSAIRTQADGYPGIPIIGRQELNEYRKKIVKKNKQAAKYVLGLYYNKKEHIVQKMMIEIIHM